MFMVDMEYKNSDLMPKYDFSSFEIKSLSVLPDDCVLAYADNSKLVNIKNTYLKFYIKCCLFTSRRIFKFRSYFVKLQKQIF